MKINVQKYFSLDISESDKTIAEEHLKMLKDMVKSEKTPASLRYVFNGNNLEAVCRDKMGCPADFETATIALVKVRNPPIQLALLHFKQP